MQLRRVGRIEMYVVLQQRGTSARWEFCRVGRKHAPSRWGTWLVSFARQAPSTILWGNRGKIRQRFPLKVNFKTKKLPEDSIKKTPKHSFIEEIIKVSSSVQVPHTHIGLWHSLYWTDSIDTNISKVTCHHIKMHRYSPRSVDPNKM